MTVLRISGSRAAAAAAIIIFLSGCGHRHKSARRPTAPSPSASSSKQSRQAARQSVPSGYTERGTASWYGVPYHGRPAADGEIYNMETLVAAHRVLPFNTWLRVTNLRNLKTVDVRVIDRGPFVNGRIIDLSKAAARQIDLLGPGIGPVKIEVLSAPPDIPSNDFYGVQVGAFSVLANAERARDRFAKSCGSAEIRVKQGKTPLYRVLAGKESSIESARELAGRLLSDSRTAMIVRLDSTETGAAH